MQRNRKRKRKAARRVFIVVRGCAACVCRRFVCVEPLGILCADVADWLSDVADSNGGR